MFPQLTLQNVLYVPDFKFNLISVNKLLNDLHLFALLTPEKCIFQDPSSSLTMAIAPVDHGLYQFQPVSQAGINSTLPVTSKFGQDRSSSIMTVANTPVFTFISIDCKNPSLDIVHARLGHTSVSKMQHLSFCKQHLSTSFACETCVIAKMHRLPFNKSHITTSSPFQLIHLDLWGPYKIANVCGAH